MVILNTSKSLTLLVDAMIMSKTVYFTRFGDNDIMMMSGTDLYNKPLGSKAFGGNRTIWSEKLQKELISSFKIEDPLYLRGVSGGWDKEPGMSDGLFASFGYKQRLIGKISQHTASTTFLIPVLFHYLFTFKPKLFDNFVDKFIRPRTKLFIGSVKKETAEAVIGKIDYYVETPPNAAYDTIDQWWPKVEAALKKSPEVIIPCCGQASRVIQGRMWNKGVEAWSIDMGSIFDPIEGNNSRTCWRIVGATVKARYAKKA